MAHAAKGRATSARRHRFAQGDEIMALAEFDRLRHDQRVDSRPGVKGVPRVTVSAAPRTLAVTRWRGSCWSAGGKWR